MHIYEDLQFEKIFPVSPRFLFEIILPCVKINAAEINPVSLVTVASIAPRRNTRELILFIDSSKHRIGNNLPGISV